MRWTLRERQSNPYSCCFCCHVRLGTVLIGILYLTSNLLVIIVGFLLISRPDLYQHVSSDATNMLLGSHIYDHAVSNTSDATNTTASAWLTRANWNCNDDRLVGFMLAIGSALLTVGMLYGTIKGYPKYLLPFFCLQVFDFCVTSLTVIGYFSYAPNIRLWINNQQWFPLRTQLASMDSTLLLMIAAVVAVFILWLKAYCISVVWNCYKFLCQSHGGVSRPDHQHDVEVVQFDNGSPTFTYAVPAFMQNSDTHLHTPANVLVLPPKYEDVLDVPDSASLEPPPYSATLCEETKQTSSE